VLLIVWIVVVVLALVVLGGVAYGVFGAFARLGREASFQRDVRPVLHQAQATAARAAESRERRQTED
jgi:hypothetical protein